jgi:hypothetical protein
MCAMGEYLGFGNLLLFGETNKKLDKKGLYFKQWGL